VTDIRDISRDEWMRFKGSVPVYTEVTSVAEYSLTFGMLGKGLL